MSAWSSVFTVEAEGDFKRLDSATRNRVRVKLAWIQERMAQIKHEPLHAQWKGFYKLRLGDWRLVYEIEHAAHRIIVHRIRKRDEVYRI